MKISKLQHRLRLFVLSLVIACGVYQTPTNAIILASTRAQQVEVLTAILSLPATIAAYKNPDKPVFKLLEHTIKAVNEAVAMYRLKTEYTFSSHAPTSMHGTLLSPPLLPWLGYDLIQSIRSLKAMLINDSTQQKPDDLSLPNNERSVDGTVPELENSEHTDGIEASTNQATHPSKLKSIATMLLACAQAALCTAAALNNKQATYASYNYELLHSLSLLTRLAYGCLQSKKHTAALVALMVVQITIILMAINEIDSSSYAATHCYEDDYATLGLAVDACQEKIKKAYHKLALRLHPDKNKENVQATEKMKAINNAYQHLTKYLNNVPTQSPVASRDNEPPAVSTPSSTSNVDSVD